jgi:hypothetical protein
MNKEFILRTKQTDPGLEQIEDFTCASSWLQKMIQSKQNTQFNIDESSVKNISPEIMSSQIDATHAGLIQYMFVAWAREQGVVLTPDILFFTVMSEIKIYVNEVPDHFRGLFSNKVNKQQISVSDLTIEKIVRELGTLIPNEELFNVITETTFTTAPHHFPEILGITFADMCTPFYSYDRVMCGIPRVKIMGTNEDWTLFRTAIEKLRSIFGHNRCPRPILDYLDSVNNNIHALTRAISTNDTAYFSDMFSYAKDDECSIDPVVAKGWILDYYMNLHKEGIGYINKYPSHFNCLPYREASDPHNVKYCYYACGLSSSRLVDGYLYPQYDIMHCEINHPHGEDIFNILALNKK